MPGNDESPNLGKQMCHVATGAPCEDSAFSFNTPAFVEIGRVNRPAAGDSVVVKLSDPFTLQSDGRLIVLAFDNDPNRILFKGKQDEGTIHKYDIVNEPDADFVALWIDANDVTAETLKLLKTSDAEKEVIEESKSTPEKIADDLKAAAEEQERRTKNLLIGAAVFVVVIVVIAAITLPKLKIPALNVA